MATLIALAMLPLAVIVCQLIAFAAMLEPTESVSPIQYSIYKLAFILPPLWYCWRNHVGLFRDVFKFRNWRNGLPVAIGLGLVGAAIFLGVYFTVGDLLIDKNAVVEKIDNQFGVNRTTVMLVAPFTVLLNSLLEEFFYRGFSFGLLVRRNRALGYLLPAVTFTAQHVLFIYHWAPWYSLLIGVVGLFVFALIVEWLYERYDTIVAPWVAHGCCDIAMMAIAAMMLS
ncbi:MAG TPA: CPBP family intramembrane glutamic endopeptidase [Pirellulales bacterium]|jgi:membrane protease YdiL (CAAX protease family)